MEARPQRGLAKVHLRFAIRHRALAYVCRNAFFEERRRKAQAGMRRNRDNESTE